MKKKKVIKHLKGDIKTFKKEAKEDRKLISDLKKKPKKSPMKKKRVVKKATKKKPAAKKKVKGKAFIEKRMHDFKEGNMHSRVKKTGPVVTNPKQAIAIALSEARKSGAKIPKKKK